MFKKNARVIVEIPVGTKFLVVYFMYLKDIAAADTSENSKN